MHASQLASRLTPRGWLIAGGVAVAAILFIYMFVHTVSAPSYSTLVSGIEPSQTGKMTSTLSAQGITYQLQNNGTAIAVQSNETAKARVALAGANLLGNTQPGLLAVRQTEPRRKQLPAAGHLPARAAGAARRNDQQRPGCLRSAGRAGAAELPEPDLRRNPGRLLGRRAAVGHDLARRRARCAGSRSWSPRASPACSSSKVTITDASGQLLWPQPARGGGGGSGSEVQEAEQRYDQTWRRASTRCSRRRSAPARRRCSCTPT